MAWPRNTVFYGVNMYIMPQACCGVPTQTIYPDSAGQSVSNSYIYIHVYGKCQAVQQNLKF